MKPAVIQKMHWAKTPNDGAATPICNTEEAQFADKGTSILRVGNGREEISIALCLARRASIVTLAEASSNLSHGVKGLTTGRKRAVVSKRKSSRVQCDYESQ